MANPVRGQVEIEVEGETFTLVFDVNALCALEGRLGQTADQIVARFALTVSGSRLDLTLLRALLWASLIEHHDMSEKDAGRLLSRAGMELVGAKVAEAIERAFPEAEELKARPRKAGASKAPAGTGKSSSGSGSKSASTRTGSGSRRRA